MSKTIVLLWLAQSASRAPLEPDLDAWAAARWARLEAPPPAAAGAKRYDPAIAAKVEELLEQARIASGSLDDVTATRRLGEVDGLLRDHAELPQAAWLMAERWYVAAGVAAHAPDGARAVAEIEARARSLEGTRATPFGAAVSEPAIPTIHVEIKGLGRRDQLWWDGELHEPSLDTALGEHHARVLRGERAVWAGWLTVAATTRSVTVRVPRPVACSFEDLEGARIAAGTPEDYVVAARGVRCESWALARPALAGGVEVASCHGSSCGPLIRWERHMGAVYAGPPQPPPGPGFPAWATWSIAGASVLAAGAVVLWRSGAFDEPAPGNTRWTFSGPN
jgi:hypothetical protein